MSKRDGQLAAAESVQRMYRRTVPNAGADPEDLGLMPTHLPHMMLNMYQQQMYTDAIIVVKGQTLHVHRAILACASPVFARMFTSEWHEGES